MRQAGRHGTYLETGEDDGMNIPSLPPSKRKHCLCLSSFNAEKGETTSDLEGENLSDPHPSTSMKRRRRDDIAMVPLKREEKQIEAEQAGSGAGKAVEAGAVGRQAGEAASSWHGIWHPGISQTSTPKRREKGRNGMACWRKHDWLAASLSLSGIMMTTLLHFEG